jgi:hypothetical protein
MSFFSNHFHPTGAVAALADASVSLDTQWRPPAGIGHPRLRRKQARAVIGTGATIGQQVRMLKFLSSDRIYNMVVTANGGTAGAANIGAYLSGANHDGAVLDVDLFASALTIAGGVSRVDNFAEAGTLGGLQRGLQLWEQLVVGGQTWTQDPKLEIDIVATITTAVTVSLLTLIFEVEYVAGD